MRSSNPPPPPPVTFAYSSRTNDGHATLFGLFVHFLGKVFWDALSNDGDDTELKETQCNIAVTSNEIL